MDDRVTEQDAPTAAEPRRKRRMKKRVAFKVPKTPARSVKELWRQASDEERERAHVTCASVLEYWLGKTTKTELAERLGVRPLRVWQLSQMAVSGMLAGLLKQPRGRGAKAVGGPQDDIKALRKENEELREKLRSTEELVRILRDFPANRGAPAGAITNSARGSKSRSKKKPPTRKKKRPASAPRPSAEASDRRARVEDGTPPEEG